jgi:hypothetical protein
VYLEDHKTCVYVFFNSGCCGNTVKNIGFEVPTGLHMKSTVSFNITPFSPLKANILEKYITPIFRVEE